MFNPNTETWTAPTHLSTKQAVDLQDVLEEFIRNNTHFDTDHGLFITSDTVEPCDVADFWCKLQDKLRPNNGQDAK